MGVGQFIQPWGSKKEFPGTIFALWRQMGLNLLQALWCPCTCHIGDLFVVFGPLFCPRSPFSLLDQIMWKTCCKSLTFVFHFGHSFPSYINLISGEKKSMKFITGSDFHNTRITCQENLDLWIILSASGELFSLFCTHSLILRSHFRKDQKPRKKLFQIIRSLWNGSLINMQELCHPWIQPIKILQSYFKEQVALKESGRERKIRLFLTRRKNLFNP